MNISVQGTLCVIFCPNCPLYLEYGDGKVSFDIGIVCRKLFSFSAPFPARSFQMVIDYYYNFSNLKGVIDHMDCSYRNQQAGCASCQPMILAGTSIGYGSECRQQCLHRCRCRRHFSNRHSISARTPVLGEWSSIR